MTTFTTTAPDLPDDEYVGGERVESVLEPPGVLYREARKAVQGFKGLPLEVPPMPDSVLWEAAQRPAAQRDGFIRTKVRELFDGTCASHRPRVSAIRDRLDRYLSESQARLNKLRKHAFRTEPHIKVSEPGQPWTVFAVAMILMLITAMVALIFGAMTQLRVILETVGAFMSDDGSSPSTALTMVGICTVIPAHLIPSLLQTDEARRVYGIVIHGLALLAGLLWVVIFTRTWAPEFQAALDGGGGIGSGLLIEDISVAAIEGPAGAAPLLYLAVTFLAEQLISISCWLGVEAIWNQHRNASLVDNPVRRDLERRANREQAILDKGFNLRGQLNSELERLIAAESAFASALHSRANRLASKAREQSLIDELLIDEKAATTQVDPKTEDRPSSKPQGHEPDDHGDAPDADSGSGKPSGPSDLPDIPPSSHRNGFPFPSNHETDS